ncbi:hypothetical protein MKW98_017820 [Papaver atlanticum]|uniref:Uncharacterized protein n=1 Tax=Papaver atlanticum TaxID=357466 RepID=A0AAD4TF69_9MAGN|nr:hypothetical protein MKW98_017820 [Papaver atlanticum]
MDAEFQIRSSDLLTQLMESQLQLTTLLLTAEGLRFSLLSSKRPEKYLGEIETWDKAESALAETLDEFGTPWKIEMLSESIDETLDKGAAKEGTEELTNQLTAFLNEQGPGRLFFGSFSMEKLLKIVHDITQHFKTITRDDSVIVVWDSFLGLSCWMRRWLFTGLYKVWKASHANHDDGIR